LDEEERRLVQERLYDSTSYL